MSTVIADHVALKNTALQFMRALRNPEVRSKWEIAKKDSMALRTLIMETLGLSALPSEADLDDMRESANAAFDAEIQYLVFGQNPPHAVGNGFMVQQ